MTTKQVRITIEAETIVKAYAGQDSISRGILMMHNLLGERNREILKLKEIADRLQVKEVPEKRHWSHVDSPEDAEFWKKMKELLNKQTRELTGQDGGL